MTDTIGEGCGLWPVLFRGWAKRLCGWHDNAYTEGSSQQIAGITQERVDKNFEDQLKLASQTGRFQWGKRQMSKVMMWFVRRDFVKPLYEGKHESDEKK